MSANGSSSNDAGGVLRPGSPARRLPAVLRQLAAGQPSAVRLELGTVVSIPSAELVELDFGGGRVTVPRIAGYTPTVGEPAWCLAGESVLLALGAVGGAAGGSTFTLPPRLDAGQTIADANLAGLGGWYTCAPAANAPGGQWGNLLVIAWPGGYQAQLFVELGVNTLWLRACYGGTYSGWTKVYPVDVNAGLPGRLRAVAPDAPGSDCNLATQNGWYSLGPSTANYPAAGNYAALLVSTITAEGALRQMLFVHGSNETWQRFGNYGAWGAWTKTFPIDDANLPARLSTRGRDIPGADCNLATEAGFYYGWAPANRPSGIDHTVLMTMVYDVGTSYAVQIASSPYAGVMYWRQRWAGTWYPWNLIWPINDGNLPSRLWGNSQPQGDDANGWRLNGYYQCTPSTLNLPAGQSWGGLHVVNLDNSSGRQLYYPHNSMVVYMRMFHSSGGYWSPWCTVVESAIGGTVRHLLPGYTGGNTDGSGVARINFGRTVTNVAGVVVTNAHTGKLNVIYSAFGFDTTGFSIYAWTVTNVPDPNAPFTVSWIATVDY